MVSALIQAGCLESRSAAAFAPAKRDTPSRSIDRQTSRRTASLERTAAILSSPAGTLGAPAATISAMAEATRTTLRMPEQLAREFPPAGLPAPHDRELRYYLPGRGPERQLTDWGRSE